MPSHLEANPKVTEFIQKLEGHLTPSLLSHLNGVSGYMLGAVAALPIAYVINSALSWTFNSLANVNLSLKSVNRIPKVTHNYNPAAGHHTAASHPATYPIPHREVHPIAPVIPIQPQAQNQPSHSGPRGHGMLG